jgi:site-specific recombinase XerD
VKGVPTVTTAPRSLTRRELGKLIRAAEQDAVTGMNHGVRNLAILQVLRNTGLRVGELVQLQLDDVEIAERSGSLIGRAGKGSKHRVVPLNVTARRALSDYFAVRPAGQPWVFLSQKGGRLTAQPVGRLVAKCAQRAQLQHVTPHTLRHSFAKDVLDQGESLTKVAALLGYVTVQTTAVYTRPSRLDLERAVASLQSLAPVG